MAILVKDVDLSAIGREIDAIGLARMEEQYPDLAYEIQQAIGAGATVTEIRRYAHQRGLPRAWVAWLEQVARALRDGLE